MLLDELISKSWYGTIGYIAKEEDLQVLEQYILYNLPILEKHQGVVVATNYGADLQQANTGLWKRYFPEAIIIDNPINRGHNHGYADLDNLVIDYCKDNKIKWLCKSANDVIFNEETLSIEIPEADFYYLNGIGYGGMANYNFNFDRIIKEDFYPQTNYYFINLNKVDFLNNKSYLNSTYQKIMSLDNYNGRIWEYLPGWSCERFLRECIERNNLTVHHLISEAKYRKLLGVVQGYTIHDCSHKQIMVNGVCHFAHPDQPIITL